MAATSTAAHLMDVPEHGELRVLCQEHFNGDVMVTLRGDCMHFPTENLTNTVCNLKNQANILKDKKESHYPGEYQPWCPNCVERLYPHLSTRTVPPFNLSLPYGERVATAIDGTDDTHGIDH